MHSMPEKVEKYCNQYWQVDAFTTEPFKGNPAAVILLDNDFPKTQICQNIATHLNLSQTAFVKHLKGNHYHIRWFSPRDEAPICGHATLASAYILFNQAKIHFDSIQFDSLAGPLWVEKTTDEKLTLIFPKKEIWPVLAPDFLCEALNIQPIQIKHIFKDDTIYVIELDHEKTVCELIPNLNIIKKIPCRAICVTAKGTENFDFVSRYFAPSVGIDEDPVCGSAHCRLTPYWTNKLKKKNLIAKQVSKRSGILHLTLDENQVRISADACIVAQGIICY